MRIIATSSHLFPGTWRNAGKAVNGRAVTHDGFFRLRFEDAILPLSGVRRPRGSVLPVQQHDVEIFGVREFAQLVEFFLGSTPGMVVTLDMRR